MIKPLSPAAALLAVLWTAGCGSSETAQVDKPFRPTSPPPGYLEEKMKAMKDSPPPGSAAAAKAESGN